MNKNYYACLKIHDFCLMVNLGYGQQERAIPQKVSLDIELYYSNTPQASYDDGDNFICYDELCNAIRNVVIDKEFALIEYMVKNICQTIEEFLYNAKLKAKIDDVRYVINLHKCNVPIDDVKGGASYCYTNLENGLLGN